MTELEWMKIFAKNLIDMLGDANMTQKELAEEMGVTEATISRYTNAERIPSTPNIIKMAYAFGCSTDDLIDFGDAIH